MTVNHSLVLTLIGPDRPGLVELLSQRIVEYEGNWVESRMARLGGQFAGILRIDLPGKHVPQFTAACDALKAEGLGVVVRPSEPTDEGTPTRPLTLEVVADDRPGIVREVAQALAAQGVNVVELTTGIESAPMSGSLLFRAKARLAVPMTVSNEQLARLLDPIGNELMADITFGDEN